MPRARVPWPGATAGLDLAAFIAADVTRTGRAAHATARTACTDLRRPGDRPAGTRGPGKATAPDDGLAAGQGLRLRRSKQRRQVRHRTWLAAATVTAAAAVSIVGLHDLLGSRHGGLPVVGQVIPAAQRPAAPAISGTTLTGQHLNIDRWRSHVVLINF